MIINKSDKKKYILVIAIFLPLLIVILSCCILIPNSTNDEDKIRQQAIEHENYLLSQMQTIKNTYNIIERNNEEIVLQNYSLGNVSIYDKNGTSIHGFIIENKTIYHNWYSIQKNNNGIFDITLKTVDRQESKGNYMNNEPYIIHDRALTINLSPYTSLNFASTNGENEFRNTAYETENSHKIKYDVKTGVTEFEMTRIINIEKGSWNTSHTLQFCTYEVKLIKIIFEDTNYDKATIMEYRFVANGTTSEELDELYESYE